MAAGPGRKAMKECCPGSVSSTANLLAEVRSSLEKVRRLLRAGAQDQGTSGQFRRLELLEQLLLDQDARLGSFDRVLEEFNYSVAHELCAPLRRISGFAREIMLRCAEELGQDGTGSLNQILDSAEQMNRLI